MTADFRFGIILFALIAVIGIVDRAMAEVDIAEERERLGELREVIDRAEDTAERARELLPPPLPADPPGAADPPPPDVPPPPSHPDAEAMTAGAERHRPWRPADTGGAQPAAAPIIPDGIPDPCPTGSNEERARCWIGHAFPDEQRAVAWRVLGIESGHQFRPEVCFGFHTKHDRECQPPLVAKTNGVRGSCYEGKQCSPWGTASGLFQHRWQLWPDRDKGVRADIDRLLTAAGVAPDLAGRLAAGLPARLDIWDGWHSTLAAAWLVGTGSWSHYQASCGPIGGCGPGRWL